MISLVLSSIVAVAAPPCTPDAEGFCTDRLVRQSLSYAERDVVVRINTALGDNVSIEFPPFVSLSRDTPLGNDSIYRYAPSGDPSAPDNPLMITLWAKVPADAGEVAMEDLLGQKTNMHLYLDSGITVTLELSIGERGRSVQRLVFEFPERQAETSYVKRRLDEERRVMLRHFEERKQGLDTEVRLEAQRHVAKQMLRAVHCAPLHGRSMRDLLVLRAHRICRLGDEVYIHFSLKNRARDLFRLAATEIVPHGLEEGGAIESQIEYEGGDVLLGFDREAQGVAAFTASDDSAARAYALKVSESGGKRRAVALGDVSF